MVLAGVALVQRAPTGGQSSWPARAARS
jgi:hypothetical protein